MAQIAARLQRFSSGYLTGPVTDAMGLTGNLGRAHGGNAVIRAAAGEGISVLEDAERLGLRLERRDTPVPVRAVAGAL